MKAIFGRLLCGLLGGGMMVATSYTPQAVALSKDELFDKFAEVPVFVVSDSSGGYVTSVVDLPNDGMGNVALLRVFFNEPDVVSFVEQVRQEDPQFNQGGDVDIVSLEVVHLLAEEDREIPLRLVFIPAADDFEAARALDSDFGGPTTSSLVPLFTLQDGEGNFVSLSVDDGAEEATDDGAEEAIISMFLSKQDADSVLSSIQESNPDVGQVTIGVVSLADLSINLLNSDNEALERIYFLPDSDVINHIQSLDSE